MEHLGASFSSQTVVQTERCEVDGTVRCCQDQRLPADDLLYIRGKATHM
jgi:hypothetical protein